MSKKVLKARHDKIVVVPCEADSGNIGGIIIPDTGKEKSDLYKIIDVGPGRYTEAGTGRIPMDSVVGELVILPKAVVRLITINGEEFGVTREVEVEAVYEEVKDGE